MFGKAIFSDGIPWLLSKSDVSFASCCPQLCAYNVEMPVEPRSFSTAICGQILSYQANAEPTINSPANDRNSTGNYIKMRTNTGPYPVGDTIRAQFVYGPCKVQEPYNAALGSKYLSKA